MRYATKTQFWKTSNGVPILIDRLVLLAILRFIPSFLLQLFKRSEPIRFYARVSHFWVISSFLVCDRNAFALAWLAVVTGWVHFVNLLVVKKIICYIILDPLHHSVLQFDIPPEKVEQVHSRPPKTQPEEKQKKPAPISKPATDEVPSTSA